MLTLPRKTTLTIAAFIAIAALLPHGARPAQIRSTFLLAHAAPVPIVGPKTEPAVTTPVSRAAVHQPAMPEPPVSYLIAPPGSLDHFFASLRRTEAHQPGAVTRILHYGDSPTTADSITSDVRRIFQARFGDAGHGFVLAAKPWAWYGHSGIQLDAHGWLIQPAGQDRARDHIHGLGGVSFTGQPGAVSRITLPDADYSRAIVYYLAQPSGGTFSLTAGSTNIVEVPTAADEKQPAFAEAALPAGTRTVELSVSTGSVRVFGWRFDKDRPGVQYSSLGINGAQIQMMDRYFEPVQWTAALRHENPALVILNYGTNESIYPEYVDKEYPDELRQAIARVRTALPEASILLMGPMDRGVMTASGDISTPEALEKLIATQQRVAAETGCAFFNTFEAMGGVDTMARWYHAEPRLVSADFMHPLPAGAAIVGKLFADALIHAYEQSPGERAK